MLVILSHSRVPTVPSVKIVFGGLADKYVPYMIYFRVIIIMYNFMVLVIFPLLANKPYHCGKTKSVVCALAQSIHLLPFIFLQPSQNIDLYRMCACQALVGQVFCLFCSSMYFSYEKLSQDKDIILHCHNYILYYWIFIMCSSVE